MSDEETKYAQIIWDYMRFEQPLEKVDVIIGLGSHDIRTAQWCSKLYVDSLAPKIVFTGGRGRLTEAFEKSEADTFAEAAIKLGVPDSDILRESNATNTGENIRLSYDLLKELNVEVGSMIIVTKPYMLRRAYATFMKQWPGEVKPKMICSAIDQGFDEYCKRNEHYSSSHVINSMVGDLQRIYEYPKLGFQIEQDIPEQVWQAYEGLIEAGYTKHLISDS